MAKMHSPRFLKIAEEARQRIREVDSANLTEKMRSPAPPRLIDVREDHEWAQGHLPGAVHLGKGILERDIETLAPNADEALILYCGGGYRSALAADALQRMGYTNVLSLAGGYRGWLEKGLPTTKEPKA